MRVFGLLCFAMLIIHSSVSKQISGKENRAAFIDEGLTGAIIEFDTSAMKDDVSSDEDFMKASAVLDAVEGNDVVDAIEDGSGQGTGGGEDEGDDGTGGGVESGGEDEATDDESSTCDGYKPAACRSCKEIDYCMGSSVAENGRLQCPDATPHCVISPLGDYCSAIQQCEPTIETLECTGAGVYPDPFECRYYHECSAANVPSVPKFCQLGSVFSPTAATNCTKSTTCVRFTCDSSKVWARYGTSTLYYGRCYNQTVDNVETTRIDVFKCTSGSSFDGNVCNFVCTKDANIQDTNFPERYFECYRPPTGNYAYLIQECRPPLKFLDGKCRI